MKTSTVACFVFFFGFVRSLPGSYSSSLNDPLLSSLGMGSMNMGMPMNGMYGGMPPPMPPPGMSPYGMNGMGYGMMGPMAGMYGSGMSPYGLGSMGGLGSQMSFPFMGKK